MESDTTVIIPFDHRVFFVRLLNCAEFSSRFSEVTQTLDAITGLNSSFVAEGSASAGLMARSASGVAPGYRLISDTGHISIVPFHESGQHPSLRLPSSINKHRLGKNGSTVPNCTVMKFCYMRGASILVQNQKVSGSQ
jgi:hypothetical protein